jgi:cobalt-zinc-cadmium resistance protein CzcA
LNAIVDWSLNNRWLVLVLLTLLIAAGLFVAVRLPIDAFPDLTNNQVNIITECGSLPPTEVEQLVTYPIESAVMGLPNVEQIRSVSKLGLSLVTIVFDDDVPTYFARQLVNERMREARSRLPEGVEPVLGPVATAFGEVYQYTIESPTMSLMDRKTLQDWVIRNQLRTVPGVNEVNSWGGETRMYTVEVEPAALQRYDLTLRDVFEHLRESNENFGGGFIEHGAEQYTVRGLGRARSPEDLEKVVLLERAGSPVLVRDVARVVVQPLPRQGAVLRDGKGETVTGMAIMLKGENGRTVIDRVKARLASITLPGDVKIVPFYDQGEVIDRTIATVKRNLFEAGLLVVATLFLFLGNLRAALITTLVIPVSLLFSFLGMAFYGVSANLMSLGAIDFGMIVDGAVIMVENCVRRLSSKEETSDVDTIRSAAKEVARPILFAVAIIIAVYLPILYLEGLERRMFRPMAISVVGALLGSLILALTVVPVLASFLLHRGNVREHHAGWFNRVLEFYNVTLEAGLRHRTFNVILALALLAATAVSIGFIGTEFMPRLDEGSILVQTRKLPGISLPESVALSQRVEQILMELPEVHGVVTKLGRPDVATEAMGVYEADVYVLLHPVEQWPKGQTKEQLIEQMARKLEAVPGLLCNFTQPMAMRLDETVSGTKADMAIKIFGDDPKILESLSEKALAVVRTLPGAADVQAEVLSGVGELHVEVDRAQLARYGLTVTDVREMVDSATGGRAVSEMIEGQRRFPITLRLPAAVRGDIASMSNLLLKAPGGQLVRLSQVARLEMVRGPEMVSRENGQRRIVVQSNVRGRDLGGFAKDAQRAIAGAVTLPPGYWIDWGGQFENQERASKRLMILLPASIAIIFGLLYATFHSARQALLILATVPFAMVGAVGALWVRHLNLNLSASIGFIALFGVAVLNGIVMVNKINELRRAHGIELDTATRVGASLLLRPILMAALVAALGFVPMAISTAPGSEVQRPLATVVIGGLITATVLTLYLLPMMYPWFSWKDKPQPQRIG